MGTTLVTIGNTQDGLHLRCATPDDMQHSRWATLTMGNTHDGQHLTMGNTRRWATLDDGKHSTMGNTRRWATVDNGQQLTRWATLDEMSNTSRWATLEYTGIRQHVTR